MVYSLRTKLITSYILVALSCVIAISLLANFLLEKQFREYIQENQQRRNQQMVASISQQITSDGIWKVNIIKEIGINGLEQGLIVKVTDNSGRVIWDATVHNQGFCLEMIAHMSRNMNSRYPNWKGAYTENKYPIRRGLNKIGTVTIGYYGPFYFNDNDLAFINTLNRILLGVMGFALLLALLIGGIMAKRLSNPISRVIDIAAKIANGIYTIKSEEKTDVREINQLTAAINELAVTLLQQEQLRKQLTADVAHELRTPLSTLQSHFEAMIDGVWQVGPERLKVCHSEIIRLIRLVNDLEKLAKYESENLVIEKTHFDMLALLQEIIINFEGEFNTKNIKLSLTGQPQRVYADRDQISQIVINLLSNALKFTPSGGMVEINLSRANEEIAIVIADNGLGIQAEDLPHIFERFYRGEKSRNRLTGGSGIGLSIAKALVEANQGVIELKSKPGAGTRVKIIIPAGD